MLPLPRVKGKENGRNKAARNDDLMDELARARTKIQKVEEEKKELQKQLQEKDDALALADGDKEKLEQEKGEMIEERTRLMSQVESLQQELATAQLAGVVHQQEKVAVAAARKQQQPQASEPEELWDNSLRRSSSESFLRRSPSPPTKVRRSLSCSPPPKKKKKVGRPPMTKGLICEWCQLPKGSNEASLRRHKRDCPVRLEKQKGKPLPYKTGSLTWKTRAAKEGRM